MASNLFDPTIEATASSADSWELENERRRIEYRLPWFLFIRSASFARLSVRRRAFQETGQLVGRGACSDVYRYRMTNQWDLEELRHDSHMIKQTLELGDVVALKRVRPPTASSEGLALVAAAKEIRVMMSKDIRQHENLVQLLAVNWEHRGDDGALWPTLVTEFCDCTLKDLLLSGQLSPETKGDLMHGIGAGIDALHEAGFVHGDLKCENCISETGGVRAIVAEVAPLADLYSFGMLIWVVVRDGSNPFQELYDLEDTLVADSKISTLAADSNTGLWDEANLADLRRQVRLATNQTITEFKRNGQLGPMVKTDLARIMGSSDVLSMHDFTWRILTLLLEPEPCKRSETTDAWMDRVNSVAKLDKPRPDTPADKPAGEPYQLSYGIFKNELVLHGNMSIDISRNL
ncbi:kinase-like protein [Thozetella sp. PMI_491]|nr:kinase-like protein [Thozetella sp. PMI_491]